MGIKTVAVFSDADRAALHTNTADEAVHIGEPAPSKSYLVIEKIIAAAKQTGAEAIHPGYGFLSENAEFAKACESAGIVFIGPNVRAIEVMGSKSASKDLMEQAGVPVAPGYQGGDQDLDTFKAEAKRIGYPVLLKASAGGGGKGMRLVEKPAELKGALESAKREALSAFGDDRFLIEKFITRPRHVEVQVFGDRHGNIVHLYERDCTVQRRHQKVIEEAPAPDLPEEVRAKLHQAAIDAAKAVEYVGAGTVVFLFDQASGEVYFMEMNTRLQVEHPVTEMVTGVDLVEWQFKVAAGEKIPREQSEISCSGHAFEARLYAEKPESGFLPSIGTISALRLPQASLAVRLDMGVEQGGAVTPDYDPMIGKLICSGATRSEALARLGHSLAETQIVGLDTNTRFLHAIATHADFAAAILDTGFINAHEAELLTDPEPGPEVYAAAIIGTSNKAESSDPWDMVSGLRINAAHVERLFLEQDGEAKSIELSRRGTDVLVNFGELMLELEDIRTSDELVVFVGEGVRYRLSVFETEDTIRIFQGANVFDLQKWSPNYESDGAAGSLAAPMPGVITALVAKEGSSVKAGDVLLVMEAMKMEHAIEAPSDGTLTGFRFQPGDQIQQGDQLVDFEPA